MSEATGSQGATTHKFHAPHSRGACLTVRGGAAVNSMIPPNSNKINTEKMLESPPHLHKKTAFASHTESRTRAQERIHEAQELSLAGQELFLVAQGLRPVAQELRHMAPEFRLVAQELFSRRKN